MHFFCATFLHVIDDPRIRRQHVFCILRQWLVNHRPLTPESKRFRSFMTNVDFALFLPISDDSDTQ